MTVQKPVFWLALALFLSLSANFFMGGMLLSGHGSYPGGKPDWEARKEKYLARMPDADRAVLAKAKEQHAASFAAMRADLEALRQSVIDAVHADPFDQAALDDVLRAEKAKQMDMLKQMQKLRLEVTPKLSPEGQRLLQKMTLPPHLTGRRGSSPQGGDVLPFIWEEMGEMPPD